MAHNFHTRGTHYHRGIMQCREFDVLTEQNFPLQKKRRNNTKKKYLFIF